MTWVTNDALVARELLAADRRYQRARTATRDLDLQSKVLALRAARAAWAAEYEAIWTKAREALAS